jgi:hypothetical protein
MVLTAIFLCDPVLVDYVVSNGLRAVDEPLSALDKPQAKLGVLAHYIVVADRSHIGPEIAVLQKALPFDRKVCGNR